MSQFDKVNRTVTHRSYGTSIGKEITRKDLIPVKDRSNRKSALTESTKYGLKEDLEKKVRDSKLNAYKEDKNKQVMLNEGYKELKETLIKDIMRQICVESLLVDEEPVMENLNNIFDLVDEQVENIGGFEGVKRIATDQKNPLLMEMVNLCEATARKVADRVIRDDAYNAFNMNDKETKEFDYNKRELGVDVVVGVVKDKVLGVFKEEQKRAQDREDILNDIKSKMEEINGPVQEAMDFIFGQNKIEELTLFNSMMRKEYKSLLETSSTTIFESDCAKDDNCEDEEEYDVDELEIDDVDSDENYMDKNLMRTSDNRINDVEDELEHENDDHFDKIIDEIDDDDEVEELMLKEGKIGELAGKVDELTIKGLVKIAIHNPEKASIQIGQIKSQMKVLNKIKENRQKGKYEFDLNNPIERYYSNKTTSQIDKELIIGEKFIKAAEEKRAKLVAKKFAKEGKGVIEAAKPIFNKFAELGEEIMESLDNYDIEAYEYLLNEMATFIEGHVSNCKDPKDARVCKSMIRDIEISTEQLFEGKCVSKKEITKPEAEGDVIMEDDVKDSKQPTEAEKSKPGTLTEGKIAEFFEKKLSKKIASRDFEEIRKRLKDIVNNECPNLKCVEILEKDLPVGIEQLKRAKIHYPDASKKIDEHIKWLNSEYKEMIAKKRKELEAKGVTESFSARMDIVCDKLDNIVEMHEDALYEANKSLESEYDGKDIILPLIESIDYNLSNIKFAYKIKVVCEALNSMIEKIENETDAVQLQEMVEINLASIKSTKIMLENNENASEYKNSLLESANAKLTNMVEKINEVRNNMDERIALDILNEAKSLVNELYDNKRNISLVEHANNERMELVTAEAITKYTILEAFNTLNLVKYDKETVRKMSRNNLR